MWLRALDISYDGALAPQEMEAAEKEEEEKEAGCWLESELTESELIQPQSLQRVCGSVVFLTERVRGGGRGRSVSWWRSQSETRREEQNNNSGLLFWLWTQRQSERSEEHTDALQTSCRRITAAVYIQMLDYSGYFFFLLSLMQSSENHKIAKYWPRSILGIFVVAARDFGGMLTWGHFGLLFGCLGFFFSCGPWTVKRSLGQSGLLIFTLSLRALLGCPF